MKNKKTITNTKSIMSKLTVATFKEATELASILFKYEHGHKLCAKLLRVMNDYSSAIELLTGQRDAAIKLCDRYWDSVDVQKSTDPILSEIRKDLRALETEVAK